MKAPDLHRCKQFLLIAVLTLQYVGDHLPFKTSLCTFLSSAYLVKKMGEPFSSVGKQAHNS